MTRAEADELAAGVLEVLARIARTVAAPAVGEPSYVHSEENERLVEAPYRARRQAAA